MTDHDYCRCFLVPVKYTFNGRPVTLGEYYKGEGGDPDGRYYVFDDEPNVTHWISISALKVRFKEA